MESRLTGRDARIRIQLSTLSPRQVILTVNGMLRKIQLVPSRIEPVEIEQILAPGQTVMTLTTDQPALQANLTDKRRVAFAVTNPAITEIDSKL
jgi:hypothetical protein